jgi:hypothetical protein
VRVKRRDLLRHSEVAQAAFTRGTVLPFSFGTVFASEASVIEEFLQPHHDELVTLLQRFEGLGEMRLRAAYRKEAVLEEIVLADAGIARLSRATESTGPDDPRRIQLGQAVADALAARQRADADAIVAALVALAHDVEIEEAQSEFDVLYGSFLIELGQAATFDARLEQIARQHEGRILFKCTGPLPAHSFVSLGSAS